MKSKLHFFFILLMSFLIMGFIGCGDSGDEYNVQTGSIIGYAYFDNETDHSDIIITLENTVDSLVQTVSRSIMIGRITQRAIKDQTTTDSSGYYELTDVEPGTYTIYASSKDSLEKAVLTDIEVTAENRATAENLLLTPVGSISGKITLDHKATGNLGILVFIASTSYMAMTDDSGIYTISDVPIGDYPIVATKDGFDDNILNVSVLTGENSTDNNLNLTPTITPSCTITFDANGGTGAMADQIVASNTIENLSPNLFTRDGSSFSGWATTPGGTVEYLNHGLYLMGSANVTLYAKWNYVDIYNFSLRDTGPAGGLIFYLNPEADTDGWKYLEAAPSDQSAGIQWYNGSFTTTGAIGTTFGTGKDNTDIIVTHQGAGSYAAQVCNDLTIGIYNDWFLPSIDELDAMYNNLHTQGVGGFADSVYWSSSEYSDQNAWIKYFYIDTRSDGGKEFSQNVRAIRAF